MTGNRSYEIKPDMDAVDFYFANSVHEVLKSQLKSITNKSSKYIEELIDGFKVVEEEY